MTAALEGGEWSAARPGRTLPPGKEPVPLHRRLGGPQGPSVILRELIINTLPSYWSISNAAVGNTIYN